MNGNDIVVGIDGSPVSDKALYWAADEAARTGARLRVVLAFHWRWPATATATDRLERYARDQAEVAVATAADIARAHRPGIDVAGQAVFGDAVDVLLSTACDAAMVVVGSRGHSPLSAALFGGTATRVAMHARGCVAVVRGRTNATAGPVVVGVDGSHTDDRLLATAFEQAARRGCDVVVIRALPPTAAPWGVGIPPLGRNPVLARATLHGELADDVQRWHEKYPTVPATARMPGGEPVSVLLDASREGQLLVVGGHAYGAVAGLLLGSVSQRLLYHADCPLLVVRDRLP